MKRIISEIIIILAFSVTLALFFNYIDPDGMNIFEKPKPNETVNDSELFGKITKTEENKTEENNNISNPIDTLAKENKDNSKLSQSEESSKNTSDGEHTSSDISDEIKTVTYAQMKKIAKDTSFIIIDARSPELFEEDRIGNAINIFPFADDQNQIVEQIFQLPYGKKIIVYCDGGNCDASHLVADMLVQFDYKQIFLYTGGWEEWINKR